MPRVKRNVQDGYNSSFAGRLRELMNENKTSQAALAEHIGVTRQAVSAYSLGTSLPDIDKFEMIAGYFGVSADYLLNRTDVKQIDATKQAVSEYLKLSEGAIDAIHFMQLGHMEQRFVGDYKFTLSDEPLIGMFSDWIETVDLQKLMSDLWKVVLATVRYNESGKHAENYKLDAEEKDAIYAVEQKGYMMLGLNEQIEFYRQAAIEEFRKTADKLADEAKLIALEPEDGE